MPGLSLCICPATQSQGSGEAEAEPPEQLNCRVQRAHLQLAGGSWPGAEEGGTSKSRKLGQGWEHRKEERWGEAEPRESRRCPERCCRNGASTRVWVPKRSDQMLLPAPHRAPQGCQLRAGGNGTPPCTESLRQGGVSSKMPSPPSPSAMESAAVCTLTVVLVRSSTWKCFSGSTGCGGCRAGWLLGLLLVAGWWSCPGIFSCKGWESSWKSLCWRHCNDQELSLCCGTPAAPASVLEQECPGSTAEIQHRDNTVALPHTQGSFLPFLCLRPCKFIWSVFLPPLKEMWFWEGQTGQNMH